jgi:hypothetical protein
MVSGGVVYRTGAFRSRSERGWLAGAVALLSVLALTAGCGKAEYRYIANQDEKTYFKVPSDWHEINSAAVDEGFGPPANPDSATALIQQRLTWSAAFDADDEPMPEHMTRVITSPSPVVYVTIRYQTLAERDAVSFDTMRDFFLPVTQNSRALAEEAGLALTSFELLYDQVLTTDDGMRGVRVVYNYEFPTGVMHTFDQTAYANADSSILYFMLLRCTARCYRERAVELDAIATSFTVRSKA